VKALGKQGADGSADAALADATAPAGGKRGARLSDGGGQASQGGAGASPPGAVAATLTGSGGGLGFLLPAILVAIAVGGGLIATLRRRRAG
jgi:hypothetical protein